MKITREQNSSKLDLYAAVLTGGATIAAQYGFDENQDIVAILEASAPVIQMALKKVLTLLGRRDLVEIERARLSISTSALLRTIKRNEDKQMAFNEKFVSEDNLKMEEIIEAAIKAAVNDCQSIKSIYYGNMIGNALFQEKYNESSFYVLFKVVDELSFDEISFLKVIQGQSFIKCEKLVTVSNADINAQEFMLYLLHFKVLGLVYSVPPFSLGATLGNLCISSLGNDLLKLLDFDVSDDDIKSMEKLFLQLIN